MVRSTKPRLSKSRISWNRGLTKETDLRVKQNAKAISEARLKKYIIGVNSNNYIRLKKDGRCAECKNMCRTEWHHIDKNRKNNILSNLIELCLSCHAKKHINKAFLKKAKMKGKESTAYKKRIITHCKQCNSDMLLVPNESKKRKFCSKKCSATYNNKRRYI